MLSYFEGEPIKIGDTVKVVGKGTCIDGTLATVLTINVMTASAMVQTKKGGQKSVSIKKIEIYDRPMPQMHLF